jgi:pilus assembly protein Flp/PilA
MLAGAFSDRKRRQAGNAGRKRWNAQLQPGTVQVQFDVQRYVRRMSMKELMKKMMDGAVEFGRDEEGAQVVEYALIIAVVSIALVIALRGLPSGTTFADFVTRVQTCLTGTCV